MLNKIEQLFEASEKGNLKRLKTLIQDGIDVNARDMYGNTALMWVAMNGHSACIPVLIEADADVNAHTMGGYTALICAAMMGRSVCIPMLIEAGADVNAVNIDNNTALLCSIRYNNSACISILIKAGAGIHSLNDIRLKNIIKNNIYTVDVLRNTAFNRRKNALLFYKTKYLDNYL
jgi:ankyrin repeat protein